MGCGQPSFVPIGLLLSELCYFRYFPTWRSSTILNFEKIFDHVTVIVVLTFCCVTNSWKLFHVLSVQTTITAECSVGPLPWQQHHGGHVKNRMGCKRPSWVTVCPLVGELWHFEYFPTWRPSAILNFKNFNYYATAFVGEAGALGGHRRPSSVRPSVCLSVCLSDVSRRNRGIYGHLRQQF